MKNHYQRWYYRIHRFCRIPIGATFLKFSWKIDLWKLAKQKTLAELVADSYVKKASQKYIANNTKDLNTAIKSELERWIDSREKQKDENKSFDNVLFSKSLRDLSREEEIVFWNNLGEASVLMNPALKNLLDYN